jgi:ferredoxin
MAFVITDACIDTKDRSCVDVCPVDCIHDDGDEDLQLYIDPDECIECGACEPACPVSAILNEEDVPAGMKAFIEINALWYKDKDAGTGTMASFCGTVS